MTTLSSLRHAANPAVSLVVLADEPTPEGTFAMAGRIHGIDSTYLLRGTPGDESARIVGCIERRNGLADAFKGAGVIGVEWICSLSGDDTNAKAFSLMVS